MMMMTMTVMFAMFSLSEIQGLTFECSIQPEHSKNGRVMANQCWEAGLVKIPSGHFNVFFFVFCLSIFLSNNNKELLSGYFSDSSQ